MTVRDAERSTDQPQQMSARVAWLAVRARHAQTVASRVNASAPAQMLKTALVAMFWVGLSPIYVQLIATYRGYFEAQVTVLGLAVGGGIAVHLWPTKTPPWRTLMWSLALSMITGMIALTLGADNTALTVSTIVGFAVIALRTNENWSRLRELVRTWRVLR